MDFQLGDAQKMLVDLADRMGREEFAPKAARWDRNHEYPHENVEAPRNPGRAAADPLYCREPDNEQGQESAWLKSAAVKSSSGC